MCSSDLVGGATVPARRPRLPTNYQFRRVTPVPTQHGRAINPNAADPEPHLISLPDGRTASKVLNYINEPLFNVLGRLQLEATALRHLPRPAESLAPTHAEQLTISEMISLGRFGSWSDQNKWVRDYLAHAMLKEWSLGKDAGKAAGSAGLALIHAFGGLLSNDANRTATTAAALMSVDNLVACMKHIDEEKADTWLARLHSLVSQHCQVEASPCGMAAWVASHLGAMQPSLSDDSVAVLRFYGLLQRHGVEIGPEHLPLPPEWEPTSDENEADGSDNPWKRVLTILLTEKTIKQTLAGATDISTATPVSHPRRQRL